MAMKPKTDGIRLPVIEELTNHAYKVGEIPFRQEWIPKGNYKGVVKELREKIGDYKIQLIYVPYTDGTDDSILVYLPQILLPSGFNATPFLANVTERDGNLNLNCRIGTDPKGHENVYAFEFGADFLGMCERIGAEQTERCAKELRELFESFGENSQTKSGINAIRLRKEIELSGTHLEESEKLIRKNGFGKVIFETRSCYIDPKQEGFISRWNIREATRDHAKSSKAVLGTSYHRDVQTPNLSNLSILLYTYNNYMLTAGDLEFLEEFSQLF